MDSDQVVGSWNIVWIVTRWCSWFQEYCKDSDRVVQLVSGILYG